MFLRFFGFGILALEVGKRDIQRFVTEPDSDGWQHMSAIFLGPRLRRSEAAQEKISRASQHFLSHRGLW
jgi:hypothetical protein